MVHLQTVERQLRAVGCNYRFFGRPEVRELAKILMPDETIAQAVNGSYEGGFALLCVTDKRLLLIDRKPLFLTLEDIRYDMVAEIDYNYRLLNGSVRIFTPNKELNFRSWNQTKLRLLIEYLQTRVMEIRQHNHAVQNGYLNMPYDQQLPQSQPQPAMPVMRQQVQAITPEVTEPEPVPAHTHGNLLTSLGRVAAADSKRIFGSGRLVTPPHTMNPYAKQPLPLSRRRTFPAY